MILFLFILAYTQAPQKQVVSGFQHKQASIDTQNYPCVLENNVIRVCTRVRQNIE